MFEYVNVCNIGDIGSGYDKFGYFVKIDFEFG